jgi:hypothetical protein
MSVFCLLASGLFIAVFPQSGSASYIYQYTGTNYATIVDNDPPSGSAFTTSESISGWFEVDTLLTNVAYSDFNITANVEDFWFTDGNHVYTPGAGTAAFFGVGTDAMGDVTDWWFGAQELGGVGLGDNLWQFDSNSMVAGIGQDASLFGECSIASCSTVSDFYLDAAFVTRDLGDWTVTKVAEPSVLVLLSAGFFGLSRARSRRSLCNSQSSSRA